MIAFAALRYSLSGRLIRPVSLVFFVAFLPGLARGDVEAWSSIGPEGGAVSALAVDPRSPTTVYAGTTGGVYKTTNGAETWLATSLPANILSLAIDPIATSTLYAGTRNSGVFKSVDGGATWAAANAGLTAARIFSLAIDPGTPATIYAGTPPGVFKSTDGAKTWTAASTGLAAASNVFALAINPAAPSTLYAGTGMAGLFRSSDGAATWTVVAGGLTQTHINSLAIDPKTPSTVYAGTNGGLFKSTDGGTNWNAVGGNSNYFFSLAIDPVTPSTVYGGAGGQVLKSVNGVATWSSGSQPYIPVVPMNALAIDPVTPSTLYVGTPIGIYRSTKSGTTWAAANRGISPVRVLALVVDPAATGTIYAGTDLGLYKSVDTGTTWKKLTIDQYVTSVFSLAVLPGLSTILAGTDFGGWKSTDGGETWTRILDLIPYAFTIVASSPSTVYAAGAGGAPGGPPEGTSFVSDDAGSTWTFFAGPPREMPGPLPVFWSIAAPSTPSSTIVGTDNGIYRIFVRPSGKFDWVTNGGLGSRMVWALAVDPASASTIWGGTNKGLFRSTDGGVNWTQVTGSLTATGIYALQFDPLSPSTLYAGTNAGVFKSTDGGSTWTALNAGFTGLAGNAFAIAPGSPQTLYVGSFGQGVFRSPTALPVADFTWGGVPIAGQPFGFADLSTGLVTAWSWSFGDGAVSTAPFPSHAYAAAGSYQVSLTVTNAAGPSTKTQTIIITPAIAGATVTKVVPIVLDVSGVGGARFGSELTLANRGTTTSTILLTYFPATSLGASGSGTVTETLGPGRQVVFADVIAYLRTKGLQIPTGSNQGGTLFVTFEGLSSADVAFAGARTTSPSGSGRAGLAYPGVRLEDGLAVQGYVFGLRENDTDRSNLALVNINAAAPITLRVTLVSGNQTSILPDVTLAGGQWTQIGHVLAEAGFASGYAIVRLVSGPGPFYTYGVFNDNTTSDGSFVTPTLGIGDSRSVLPVLVETGTFQSELVLANPYPQPIVATITYVESLSPSSGTGGVTTETLGPYEQKIIPGVVDYLRGKGVSIGARGSGSYAGAARVTFALGSGGAVYGFAGARTSAPANGGGQYGLFYRAMLFGDSVPIEAWVFGLQQNATNRSNLAVVNIGNASDSISYRLEVYDGDTGRLVGSSPVQNLPAGGWFQISSVLASYGVSNGYLRVVRVSGGSWMLAYGVVNDGAMATSGATNDGSFVLFSNR